LELTTRRVGQSAFRRICSYYCATERSISRLDLRLAAAAVGQVTYIESLRDWLSLLAHGYTPRPFNYTSAGRLRRV